MHSKKNKFYLAISMLSLMVINGVAYAKKPVDSKRVIVQFKQNHGNAGKAAMKRMGGRIKINLNRHNAVSMNIPAGKLDALSKNKHVEFWEEDVKRYPIGMVRDKPSTKDIRLLADDDVDANAQITPYGVPMVQADLVSGNVNNNISVCVIDSGYSMGHEDKPDGSVVTGTDDTNGAGAWTEDGSGHGTHTSGTINALDNQVGIIGVFPNAPMHIIRVFGDDGIWAYSSSLIAALDDCIDNNASVISMSLGGDFPSRMENMAFRKAEKNGILSIASAGNDGNNRMNYPASYHSVMSVAAVDSDMAVAGFSQRNTHVEIAAPGVSVLSTVPVGSQMDVTVNDFTVIPMDGFDIPGSPVSGSIVDCGLGENSEACGDATDKICLIERGGFSFAQKALSCESSGGIAAIVYNRNGEDGHLYGTLGGTQVSIPVVGMLRVDGLTFSNDSFATLSFIPTGYDYDYFSGTSMSAPHVSGIATLIWSNYPQCSGNDIRQAINATAMDLGAPGNDHSYGNGLVQAKEAMDYLATYGCSGSD